MLAICTPPLPPPPHLSGRVVGCNKTHTVTADGTVYYGIGVVGRKRSCNTVMK